MPFEWDAAKEEANRQKHGIDFSTAAKVFTDPDAITDYDADHRHGDEDRWTTVGLVSGILILVRVTWTDGESDSLVRIISARLAGPKERLIYYEGVRP